MSITPLEYKRANGQRAGHAAPFARRSTADDLTSVSASCIAQCAYDWFLDCEARQHSLKSIDTKKVYVEKFLWFLGYKQFEQCGISELRAFFAYLTHGHKEPGGRFGNRQLKKPLRPISHKNYYICLQSLFKWIIEEGYLSVDPFKRIEPPVARPDQLEPFSDDEVKALFEAAGKSQHPARDILLLILSLDLGLRASEICNMTKGQINEKERSIRLLGKGNKERTVHYGATTARCIHNYLSEAERGEGQYLFASVRGITAGEPLTRNGLGQLYRRLGKVAGIKKCGPHKMRRTFAVTFRRDGGGELTLMNLLGHTTLTMTSRYVKFADADLQQQSRQHSPADRLFMRKSS